MRPARLVYAVVQKVRSGGWVVAVAVRLVFGTLALLRSALRRSSVSTGVNVSFLERANASDRHRNARKTRKTYRFSKSWAVHEAMSYFTLFNANFCCPVRTLRRKRPDRTWEPRTPAMVAGLTDHVWQLMEWVLYPVVQRCWDTTRLTDIHRIQNATKPRIGEPESDLAPDQRFVLPDQVHGGLLITCPDPSHEIGKVVLRHTVHARHGK